VNEAPRALRHRVTLKLGETQRVGSTDAARVTVTGTPKVIGPPLRGADWLAANGPSNSSGHRRSILPVEGTARIPQRFAIDWLQLRPDGSRHEGDPKDNKNYRAYGQEALAVADGVDAARRARAAHGGDAAGEYRRALPPVSASHPFGWCTGPDHLRTLET